MIREYECDEAQRLQDEWKKILSIPLPDGLWSDEQKAILMRDRETSAYREAITALVDHLAICPECAHLRTPDEPVEDAPAWNRWLKYSKKDDDDLGWNYTNI